MPLALLLTNALIALCYYAIASLVGVQLFRARGRGLNPLGMATAGIFLTCALGHSVHVFAFFTAMLTLAGAATTTEGAASLVRWLCGLDPQPIALAQAAQATRVLPPMPMLAQLMADAITVVPAVSFLALRRRYGLFVDGESVILDYERSIAVERARLAERTAALASMEERARELAEARAQAEQAHQAALQSADALRVSETFLRTVIETAPIGIATLGAQGVFQTVNPALCTMLGSEAAQLQRRTFHSIVEPADHTLLDFWESQIMADPAGVLRTELRLVRAEERSLWVALTITTIQDGSGRPTAGLVLLEDVTERRAVEEERLRMERGMLEAQRLESLGVLAGGIAHDFNNILTSILGYTELAALDLPPNHPAQLSLTQVQVGAQRAAELVHQMLAYAGKGRFSITTVQLSELVHEMSDLLQVSLGKHAQLQSRLDPTLAPVAADVAQLRQVVLNLLTNGAEAIGPEGGTVLISTAMEQLGRAELDALVFGAELEPGSYVALAVADNGIGMDEEVQQHMFDPFFSTKFTGRGLGLSAVQGIVRAHHGALLVQSAPGEGTSFQIWLPVTAALSPQPPRLALQPVGGGTLLVIDDEESVRRVLARMLTALGYTVVLASDGGEGLALLRAGIPELRGVFIDLTMPGLSGIEVAERLAVQSPHTPITLMSGYSAAELATRSLPARVVSLLQKPYTLEQVRAALATFDAT